jgi:DNA mismatch endonuclease (patch repair protein)
METQARRDTAPEIAIRSAVHGRGLRFWVDRSPLPKLRRRADLVFSRAKVAVFVDGCFWHGCPQHGTLPKANADWWRHKLEQNRHRDRDTDERLMKAGWVVIRFWEHDEPEEAARTVARIVQARQARL